MNKQIYFLISFLCVCFVNPLFSNSSEAEKTIEEQIILFGYLGVGEARSQLQPQPIQVTKDNDKLEIKFTKPLNVVSVEITDEAGNLIYVEDCNTNDENQVSIYLYGLEEGIYNVSFISETGGYLSGDFEVE
jgi:hypothetical protein